MSLGDTLALLRAAHRDFPRAELVYHEDDPLAHDIVVSIPGIRLRFDPTFQLLTVCLKLKLN